MAEMLSRWREGLTKTSKGAFGRLASLLGATEIKAETWEELEALLIQADLGMETTSEVIFSLKKTVSERGLTRAGELRDVLRETLLARLEPVPSIGWPTRPSVILVVGVNGSGKTTTIAKLGYRLKNEGKSVLFG